MSRFADKTVIVTGAGSGIGEGAARRFSREGAKVVLVGRDQAKLDAVAAGLPAERTLVHVADVSQENDVDALIEAAVAKFGSLDVVVNAAGVFAGSTVTESTTEDWRKVMSNDVDSIFFMCRAAMPHLIESQGNIVNVSSVSGLGGDWNSSLYNAAKGAVTNFTRAIAMDYGSKGVRVNAVCPSLTASNMTKDAMEKPERMESFKERTPLWGPATPEDIAGPIAFLASEDARYVTGVNLPVDGGVSASNGQPPQG
jgi:meso-butanediol dehydrogenase/(S,S)-butanediol dehydrogenase/diacetyl reductase